MPSLVLVGDLGSHWGPAGAFGGPQTGSNTPVRRERLNRFRTVNVHVLGVAPRGFTLGEKSLPTAQGTCGRLSAAVGSRARALWALRVAILAPHDLIVYRSFRSELFTWNSWLKVGPRVTLGVSDCRVK